VPEIIVKSIPLFKNLNIIILLDEYENFLEHQQVVINTLLKFTRPHIKFRIGMRLEGFRTFKMIAEEDFIKEYREYRKVIFEEALNKDKRFHRFLEEISRKRLESIGVLREKGFINIKTILSKEENLEDEAIALAKNKPNKIYEHFSKKVPKEHLDKVRYKDNPLLELLNYIWLTRGVTPEKTYRAMRDYLDKNKTEAGAKYERDYIHKYKLSLMFLLCSIYKKPKLYYSFNTFAFLSSGIVGNFIELCRGSFANAGWDDDLLLQEGKISKASQSHAARDFSKDEIHQISRIETYGGEISTFIRNIGNIFLEYHLDFHLRYPETNQFAVNLDAIKDKNLRNAMSAAIKWSVIQRKPKMQRTTPGDPHLEDTYITNRIFAPSFQISYRTRGGKSVSLNEKNLRVLMHEDNTDISKYIPNRNALDKEEDKNTTARLFPGL